MVNSISPNFCASTPQNKKINTAKVIAGGVTGAVAGGGVAYLVQQHALAKAAQKAAMENAPKTILSKTLGLFGAAKDKVVGYCKEGISKVVKDGKISKMGIAKAAVVTGLAVAGAIALKNLLFGKKEDKVEE